jgi:hypothetical protein
MKTMGRAPVSGSQVLGMRKRYLGKVNSKVVRLVGYEGLTQDRRKNQNGCSIYIDTISAGTN